MNRAIIENLKLSFALAFCLGVVWSGSATAQGGETEAATESQVLRVMLPANAQRVLPQSVPAEITETLEKVTAAGGGKFRQGETEVLLWAGANYKKANAPAIVNRLTGSLKTAGWQYSVEGEENGVTVFTALQASPRRAVVGFYGATDDALILAAMEILPNGVETQNNDAAADNQNDSVTDVQPAKPAKNTGGGGAIVGSWYDGYVSMVGFTPQVGPLSYTPGRSHRFAYVFHPNGTFEFTGLMKNTVYNCTTTYFQDKRGRYTINGNQLTLTLTKNLWRKQESCAPSSNTEVNHKLDPETYTFSVRRNKDGKDEVCLNSGENTPCYQREGQ